MDYSEREILEGQAQVWKWALSYMTADSIKCAVQLRIPDLIHNHNPQHSASLQDLISALRIPPSKSHAFRCMMRILTTPSTGFLTQKEDETTTYYSLTPASRLLLVDHPAGQRQTPILMLHLHPAMNNHCSALATWLLQQQEQDGGGNTSSTAYEAANGMSFWDYLAAGPMGGELKGLFYDCMVSDSKLVADALLAESTSSSESLFGGVGCLVDVAGGTGVVAAAVARAYPDMKCVVLDLPHVVAGWEEEEGYPGNLEFVGGDMFRCIPSADAILLKWILHNWDDKHCVELLKSCKEAVLCRGDKGKQGKVIIIDMVVWDKEAVEEDKMVSHEVQLYFDFMMTTVCNGKERNETEWKKLFEDAGFSNYKIIRSLGPRSIIEAYP